MRFWPKVRRNPAEDVTLSSCTYSKVPCGLKNLDKPLNFWYIRSHDRKALMDYIMPYLAGQLPRQCLLQTTVENQAWAKELLYPDLVDSSINPKCLHQTEVAFWEDPANVIEYLLQLSRLLIFALLRFTYREEFLKRGRKLAENRNAQEYCFLNDQRHCSELTKSEVHRLTCIRSKYGVSFYRHCYKKVKQCLHWSHFSTKIRSLGDAIGLLASSHDPERNLHEIRRNLATIMMSRKWVQTMEQLNENTSLICDAKKLLDELNVRRALDVLSDVKTSEETKKNIAELQLKFRDLQLACPTPRNLDQRDTKLYSEMEKQRLMSEKEIVGLRARIEACEGRFQQFRAVSTRHTEGLCSKLGREHTGFVERNTAESLVICRWLLEHLPVKGMTKIPMVPLGRRWQQFWRAQWSQRGKKSGHPLKGLAGGEKYNKVGLNLYGTLSNRLHEYGHQQGDMLDPVVLIVVGAISPIHYCSDGKVDLGAERKRWLD